MVGIIITAPGQHQVCQARPALLQKKKMKEEEGMREHLLFEIIKSLRKESKRRAIKTLKLGQLGNRSTPLFKSQNF